MDTATATQPKRSAARLLASLITLAVAGFVALAAFGGYVSAESVPSIEFGCSGLMVISNTDCEMGGADAYNDFGMAPWCDGQTDMTVYGCFNHSHQDVDIVVDRQRARLAGSLQQVPTTHPEGDMWIGDILLNSEQNRVLTRCCLAPNGHKRNPKHVETSALIPACVHSAR